MESRAGTLRLGAPARLLACLGVAAAVLAAPARAQHGFVPPEDRPLHERLAAARVVAIATVAEVRPGRIAFEDAVAVLGTVEPELELKRAPSRPPPWVAGDRVLLLLTGARSPYRWVEKPVEAWSLADAVAERRVAEAVRALDAVRTDAAARRDLYALWSDGSDADLAAQGQRGLLDAGALAGTTDEAFALERARVAADADQPIEVRRRAARIAARYPEGVAALLAHLARTLPDTDARIAELALQSGLIARAPGVEARLVQLLDAPESELGELGFRFASFATGPEVERKLSELAVGHPDASVRTEATQALKSLRKRRASRGG